MKGADKIIDTCAFLDSGSNTSFCTEKLLSQLNVEGRKASLFLTTLESVNATVKSSFVDLEVLDLREENLVELCNVFSRPRLPISKGSIADQDDVNRWPHLDGVEILHIDAEVGLLIGSDVPQALQPLEVRQCSKGGPFATRTIFGWVLNGPLGRSANQASISNFVTANPIIELNRQFKRFCNMTFKDSIYDTNTSMSHNDSKAMRIMNATVKQTNGHCEIALPWKNYSTAQK